MLSSTLSSRDARAGLRFLRVGSEKGTPEFQDILGDNWEYWGKLGLQKKQQQAFISGFPTRSWVRGCYEYFKTKYLHYVYMGESINQ